MFANDDPEAKAEVSDLIGTRERLRTTNNKLLEVYQLTKTIQGTPVIFEAYFRYKRCHQRRPQTCGGSSPRSPSARWSRSN